VPVQKKLTILIADDHWVSRTGMRHLLEQLDEEVELHEAASFDQVLAVVAEHPSLDLIVLDLLMPGMDAFEGLNALKAAAPKVPVIVMTMVEDRRYALRAIDLGAMGYVLKTGDPDDSIKAIRQVLDGDLYLPRGLISSEATSGAGEPTPFTTSAETEEKLNRLTRRQRDVFWLLGHGKSNIDIARELGISEFTARQHVSAILRKLEFTNRTQVALFASQHQKAK
jgi:DNA-binding NarL/FixJ family response regulator